MTLLCRLRDLEATGAKGVTLEKGRPVVVIRTDDGARAFLNICPHMGATLETFPDRFLDETGDFLLCAIHGARFSKVDGHCVSGPCIGRSLRAVPVVLDGDAVLVEPG